MKVTGAVTSHFSSSELLEQYRKEYLARQAWMMIAIADALTNVGNVWPTIIRWNKKKQQRLDRRSNVRARKRYHELKARQAKSARPAASVGIDGALRWNRNIKKGEVVTIRAVDLEETQKR